MQIPFIKFKLSIAVAITTLLLIFICCDRSGVNELEIFHLAPNRVITNEKSIAKNGWFKTEREDFFALKNFNIENQQQKAIIDSFIINYIKNDNFLNVNDNSSLSLVFFKYGNGITENTTHQYYTDYDINQLFAFKKRLIYYYFTSDLGYVNTGYYFNNAENIKEEERPALNSIY